MDMQIDVREIEIIVTNHNKQAVCNLKSLGDSKDLLIHHFEVKADEEFIPKPISLAWKVPAIRVKGVWTPTADFSKRIKADWELEGYESRISIDAPVLSLFGNDDENVICFSCSNAVNTVELSAKYREEDNHFYYEINFFKECRYPIKTFNVDIRIDRRYLHFSKVLSQTASWWESFKNLIPTSVPSIAKKPLYSTWYQLHQNLDKELLLSECKVAKELGFESIIIDDGWQTNDNNRGYDYTGDWLPERFPEISELVEEIQQLGMKVGLWYSVPFCGVKSEAFKKFKDRLLTTEHRWAPVFDPRYPEVRKHLLDIYLKAASEWKLDGFKLDFIDEFKSYKDTSFEEDNERDFSSINKAVECLLNDVIIGLKKINPDIFIEFRQKYTGPAIRKYGSILRAFDCPGDYTMNRVRIADLRLLSGNTAVHSDMVTWHFDETVEDAALHYINTMFGVPQISVMLRDAPKSHLEMIKFYTQFWNENSDILLAENFVPKNPLGNYPMKQAEKNDKIVIGVYDHVYLKLKKPYDSIVVINAKLSNEIIFQANVNLGNYQYKTFSCIGEVIEETIVTITKGVCQINVPKSGLLQMSFIYH